MSRKLVWVLALLSLTACEKKEAPPPTETTEKAAPAATPSVVAAAPTPAPSVDVDSLPVEEEFESEAEKELTPANLNAKLDALEKEIDAAP